MEIHGCITLWIKNPEVYYYTDDFLSSEDLPSFVSLGVAVMHMQSPPVNSLSLDFLTEFCISVEKLEMDKACRGLIITSV